MVGGSDEAISQSINQLINAHSASREQLLLSEFLPCDLRLLYSDAGLDELSWCLRANLEY